MVILSGCHLGRDVSRNEPYFVLLAFTIPYLSIKVKWFLEGINEGEGRGELLLRESHNPSRHSTRERYRYHGRSELRPIGINLRNALARGANPSRPTVPARGTVTMDEGSRIM